MNIVIESVETKPYRPLFGREDIEITVVGVRFPDHDIYMSLSHRTDDPEDAWACDFRMNGSYVMFSHGEGDRTCRKDHAVGELLDAIKAAV